MNGNALSGADQSLAEGYSRAQGLLSRYSGDPVGEADALIAQEPRFVMAHVLKAWLLLLATDPTYVPSARSAIDAAQSHPHSVREGGHLRALRLLADGQWYEASRVIEDVAIAYPNDLLALIAGHQIDFFTGHARLLRDRIARALPSWSASMPGYHSVLGMHAFGLEEGAEYGRAEAQGRHAIAVEPRDSWARHAVAHVLEMQGRHDEGIAFMRGSVPDWAHDSFLSVHNWWHLALYHLELGEIDEVLALVDGPIGSGSQPQMLELVDRSAMLWRLHLRGVELGDRWARLAAQYRAFWRPGHYAFNDVHAAMAFIGAGDRSSIEETVEAQRALAPLAGDNASFSKDVGLPLIEALVAFDSQRYQDAALHIRRVRGHAARFGGSNAQRDVIDLTMLEAALRADDRPLAQALSAERLSAKHDSPLAALFARRAGLAIAA
jgi:hypothetical protein